MSHRTVLTPVLALILVLTVPATLPTVDAGEGPTVAAGVSAVDVDTAECAATTDGALRAIPVVPASHPVQDPCPGIRPGGALVIPVGPLDFVYCSMAFIVTDGSHQYVATAGHCVDPDLDLPGPGDRVSALGVPGTFGTVAYQWCEGGDVLGNGCAAGSDFALIRIDDDKAQYVSTAMCHWGAPSGGVFTARDNATREVHHFGWGMVIGDPGGLVGVPVGNPATQARAGAYLATEGNYSVIESAAISGDSGSGVLVSSFDLDPLAPDATPRALGVLTHISVGGLAIVQRMDVSLAKAGADMGETFALAS